MKIDLKTSFKNRLAEYVAFIAKDSPNRARQFNQELIAKIKKIPEHPRLHRPSIWFEEENVRDLIYQSHTIIYRIKEEQIEVFGFVSFQDTPMDEE